MAKMLSTTKKNLTERIGYLVIASVPDLDISYDQLNQLATQVSYPAEFLPTPPEKKDAWRKATQTGAKGIEVKAPAHITRQIEAQYKTTPRVRVVTREISRKHPRLVRHLVREAVVDTANRKEEQLDLGTVAVLEFDTDFGQHQSATYHDDSGFVNGEIQSIVMSMETRMIDLLTQATGRDVWEGCRALLESLFRVCLRGTGGVYFVPEQSGARQTLLAMRDLINALAPYQKPSHVTPSCTIITMVGESAEDIYQDVITSAVDDFKTRLMDLAQNKLDSIFSGRSKGKSADTIVKLAFAQFLEIKSAINAYRAALADDLDQLDMMLEMADQAVYRALAFDTSTGD